MILGPNSISYILGMGSQHSCPLSSQTTTSRIRAKVYNERGRQLRRPHFLLRPPTGDDYVLSSARGKFGVVHVSVANHYPRLDSLDAGCIRHGSRPWQIDGGVARHGHDLWAVGASRAPHSRQATRQQNRPRLKLGHCTFQIRPLRVKTGQYRTLQGNKLRTL